MSEIKRFFTKNQYRNLFLLTWLVLGLIQASFSELWDDEAYYWVYSRHMDWGYFDHPPMIALLIKLGYSIFHNELGVRLLIVVVNTLTLWITAKLIAAKDNTLFYLLIGAMGAMQIGGMLAVPDVPLIFFAAVYFWAYRNFLSEQNWKNTLLLGVSMALMFYSKYHGVLLVFFTVLSNINLLKVFKFYIACILTTLLFLPHIYWQYTHGFPSLQYHLIERNATSYDITYTLDYIGGQLLLFGPLLGWLILYYAFRCPIQHTFERALKFNVIGVLVFFLLSTFKGRVEANWTVMLFTPTTLLAHHAIMRRKLSWNWLVYTLPVTLLLVLATRVYMIWDFMPGVEIRPEIHHNKEWTSQVAARAAGRPVVFMNSYQLPSKYMFYTGQLSYSLNSRESRRSQYNFWDTETQLWGKPVMVIFDPGAGIPVTDSVKTILGTWDYNLQPHYYSYSLIQLKPALKAIKAKRGERVNVILQPDNGYRQPIPLDREHEPVLGYVFMHQEDMLPPVKSVMTLERAILRRLINLEVVMPEKPGKYQLKFSIFAGELPPTHNSPVIPVTIE
ncbi:ArnT family glycosyltransferase [Chitinophaga nivalis]|uniref:Glycosyltransferase family 39 protein n=1 Tax=Chitinophaga nivalis TaxID=2991709 RepID=A0ABT3IW47_9BACT|nr:glycosyltransferase family 39 protein [Chitinophaga nivalis]MCW3462140.1 glycosyltransferase family 39 protein [Chitinophaga nivalis]MCW3488168.1 glycosyltransferase family 39 protein [Chitinophaga nivalis]